MEEQDLRLDVILYIGIAVDVVLAIIACVLIHTWRKRKRERDEDRQGVDRMYGVSQRTERETIPMDSRSVSRIGEPDPGRNNFHMKPAYVAQTSERGSHKNDADSEGIRNSYVNEPTSTSSSVRYPQPNDDTVIQNPLYESSPAAAVRDDGPDSPQGREVSLSTYYTYNPPENQLDEESSEVQSQPEVPEVSSAEVDRYLELIDKASEQGSRSGTPRNVPLPVSERHEYTYIDVDTVQPVDRGDKTSMRSGSTMNFNEEPVSRLYSTEIEESTPVM